MWFSKDTFHQMVHTGWIIDGRGGGFVIGRSHADGNIYMIQESKDGRFFIPGHMEGGEYILSADAYFTAKERLEQINGFKDDIEHISSISFTPKSRILNTHAKPYDKLLWIDTRGQFIINRRATSRHFQEIEEINHKFSGFTSCDLDVLSPKNDA